MNRMRLLRREKKMTMKQLGEKIGLAESTISLYETGKHEPDHKTLAEIADVLGVSVDYLLGRTEVRNSNEKENQPTANGDELDEKLVNLLVDLSPSEVQRVRDFVSGLKASRKEESSPQ